MESNKSNPSNSASDRFLKILPIVLIFLYLSLAVIKIRYPGVQYDEILWGNAALGGIDWTFITCKVGNLPVLLMPYIGAVKAYIYYPVFKAFGVSPWSIRVPTIIIAALSLYLLFCATRRYFDDKTALLALFFLSIDPSFISQTRVDCGPIVLEFSCKALTLYLLVKLLERFKFRYLLGIYVILATGLFNKLNFIWYVNSFLLGALLIYSKDVKNNLAGRPVKQKYLLALSSVMGYFLLVGYYLFISYVFGLSEPINLGLSLERLAEIFGLLKKLINGESFYVYALGDIHSLLTNYYSSFILILMVLGLMLISIRKGDLENKYKKSYYFFALILITTLYQICITRQAGANWHLFSVYPFITILLSSSVVFIAKHLFNKDIIRKTAACALIMIIASYCIIFNAKYINAYDLPTKNISWSKAIYDLIEYTKGSSCKFVSMDWGIQAQLITFDPVEGKYQEIDAEDFGDEPEFIASLVEPDNNFAFIMHPPGGTLFMEPRLGIFEAAERSGIRLKLVKTISDGGRDIFEIYLPEKKVRSGKNRHEIISGNPDLQREAHHQ